MHTEIRHGRFTTDSPMDIPSVQWSGPVGPIARGRAPTVALNNAGQLVLIYSNSIWTPRPELRARVGELRNGEINWHDERGFDTGQFPSAGINDQGQVVSTHQGNNGGELLFYNVGQISGGVVEWLRTGGTQYTTGHHTSVDLDNHGKLVEVHTSAYMSTLWSMSGQLENDGSITWLQESTKFDNGVKASVALNNTGKLVEFHEAPILPTLWASAGALHENNRIRWFDDVETDGSLSANPRVDLNDHGVSVQIHISVNGSMWYRVGKLKGDDRHVDEGAAAQFLTAFEYDVAIDDHGHVVVVFAPEDTIKAENLYYMVGQLT